MTDIALEIAKQVPSLTVLVWLADRFMEHLDVVNSVLRDLTVAVESIK